MIDRLKCPVFFIGFPRSGTTVFFEAFVRNSEFGWLANYADMWPRAISANIFCRLLDNRFVHLRGHKKQYGSVRFGNRFLPQPVEAYAFWDYYTEIDFSRNYLLGQTANDASSLQVREALKKTLLYQGKTRFATKLTGPGRIQYLLSIFPDAQFVHVIRDGRATVESLHRVEFWRDKGGMDAPFWVNGLEAEAIDEWEQSGRDSVELASYQWKRVVETTISESRNLGKEQYVEVKYEDLVNSPQSTISDLLLWAGGDKNAVKAKVELSGTRLANMNKKYLGVFNEKQIVSMNRIMGPMLTQLGYAV